jgi:hypothetical protein
MARKVNRLDLNTQLEIISLCEVSRSPKIKIGRQYRLTFSTLFTISKNKEKMQSAVLRDGRPVMHKLMRNMENEDSGPVLFECFCQERSAGVPTDRSMIKAKANHFAARLEINNFQCSVWCLHCFKVRKGISMHKMPGKAAAVDPDVMKCWAAVLNDCLHWYSPQDIYNAGKISLHYILLPNRTLTVKDDPCKGGKRSMKQLTVCARIWMVPIYETIYYCKVTVSSLLQGQQNSLMSI